MKRYSLLGFCVGLTLLAVCQVRAQDYRAEALEASPPADAIAPEILAQLNPHGVRVLRGTAPLCDLWLGKQLAVKEGFQPTSEVLYPLTPGQLIGVARFAGSAAHDFRDQQIEEGVYTLRYQQQPVDGNHVGTSLTRDFLLLVKSADDRGVGLLGYEGLIQASAEAAGTSHPCLLSLQKPVSGDELMRRDEARDWWIVRLGTQTAAGAALPLEVVVVGLGLE
jgi:hypothetical protein